MNQGHFSQVLKESYLRRNFANPKYSLRAFARDLEMEPAQLSRIFSRKQKLSLAKAKWVAAQLFESNQEREYFLSLVEVATAKKEKAKRSAEIRLAKLRESKVPNLAPEALAHLSSWLHIAVLDLLALRPFSAGDASAIGSLLGVSAMEARLALDGLIAAGLVRKRKNRLEKATSSLRTTNDVPSAVIRNLHKQFMQKGIEALETQSVEERYYTAKTIAVSREGLLRIKELADEFNRRLSELAAEADKAEDLYQINIQCFRLLKGRVS